MIIGPNFVFVHMPKTGGVFALDFFIRFPEGLSGTYIINGKAKHRPLNEFIKIETKKFIKLKGFAMHLGLRHCGKEHQQKFKFGFIRNPFDWYVSWWAKGESHQSFKDYMRKPNMEKIPQKWIKTKMWGNDLGDKYGFMTLRFLDIFYKPIGIKANKFQAKCLANNIFKFEDGIRNILKKVLCIDEKKRNYLYDNENLNISDHRPYREYYDSELIEQVKNQDKLILDLFGYDF